MGSSLEDTTSPRSGARGCRFLGAYETLVERAAEVDGGAPGGGFGAAAMRAAFQRRTGTFRPDDPWFEARSRAFWDDALTTPGFASRVAEGLGEHERAVATRLGRAHRGLFVKRPEARPEGSRQPEGPTRLVDLWSGAQLIVEALDDAQALSLAHAEAPMDARVAASGQGATLHLLPGAFHHPADALEPALAVLEAARERGTSTADVLDALMRMELVFRTSSRVKVAFAYRVEGLPPA